MDQNDEDLGENEEPDACWKGNEIELIEHEK